MNRIRALVRNQRSDRGVSAVEMALLMPMLLLVVFGVIDFGRMLNAQITLTEAAREGARAESFGEDADTRVQAASANLGKSPPTDPVPVTTVDTSCPAEPTAADNARVTVTYEFHFITPVPGLSALFGGSLSDTKTLTATGIMPCRA